MIEGLHDKIRPLPTTYFISAHHVTASKREGQQSRPQTAPLYLHVSPKNVSSKLSFQCLLLTLHRKDFAGICLSALMLSLVCLSQIALAHQRNLISTNSTQHKVLICFAVLSSLFVLCDRHTGNQFVMLQTGKCYFFSCCP